MVIHLSTQVSSRNVVTTSFLMEKLACFLSCLLRRDSVLPLHICECFSVYFRRALTLRWSTLGEALSSDWMIISTWFSLCMGTRVFWRRRRPLTHSRPVSTSVSQAVLARQSAVCEASYSTSLLAPCGQGEQFSSSRILVVSEAKDQERSSTA